MEPSTLITCTMILVHSETFTGSKILLLTIISNSNLVFVLMPMILVDLLKIFKYYLDFNKFVLFSFSVLLIQFKKCHQIRLTNHLNLF